MAQQDVTVYNSGGSYTSDIGKTVLPAAIKPIDFTSLDKAMQMERDISEKALQVVAENVKKIGTVQDAITGIQTPTEYHALQLEDAKKSAGVDQSAIAQAANNIDNPMALYDIDRKMKKLAMDPRVKNIMYDNAILEAYKNNIQTITDPGLRTQAMMALNGIEKSPDPNAIRNLNIDQYKEIDLEGAYLAALDNYAPFVTKDEQVYENGTSYTKRVTQRDPAAVAKTRQYFMQNPLAKNNLIAKGYIDTNGKPTPIQGDKSWFDDFEAAQSSPSEQILNVKGATGASGAAGGNYSYSIPQDFKEISYTPQIVEDKDYGTSFDLGVISAVETGGRAPDNVVHLDPGNKQINLGAYSFNGANGRAFLDYVEANAKKDVGSNADIALSNMKAISLTNKDNLGKAKATYAELEKSLPPGELKRLEDEFAVEKFAKPVLDYVRNKEKDRPFTPGEATLLMDIGIQWKETTWKKWINEYYADESGMSMIEFLTKKRIEEGTDNANKGLYGLGGAAVADSINTRALKVLQAAMSIDGSTGGTGAQSQSAGQQPTSNGSMRFDPSMFGAMDSDVQTQADSISTNSVPDYYTKMKQPQ